MVPQRIERALCVHDILKKIQRKLDYFWTEFFFQKRKTAASEIPLCVDLSIFNDALCSTELFFFFFLEFHKIRCEKKWPQIYYNQSHFVTLILMQIFLFQKSSLKNANAWHFRLFRSIFFCCCYFSRLESLVLLSQTRLIFIFFYFFFFVIEATTHNWSLSFDERKQTILYT